MMTEITDQNRFTKPAAAFARAVILAGLLLGACAPDPRDHYVRSATAHIVPVPLVSATNLPENHERMSFTFRGSYQDPVSARLPVRAVTQEPADSAARAFRGQYDVSRPRYAFGFELRESPFEVFDWFLSAGVGAEQGPRAALLAGIGVTLPFPWLNLRVAPMVGVHGYTNSTDDSTIVTRRNILFPSIVTRDTVVVRQKSAGTSLHALRALSVSLWPTLSAARPLIPYLQYQTHWIDMSASDSESDNVVPQRVIALRGHALAAGLDYRIRPSIGLGARGVWEHLANGFGSTSLYRVESSLTFRADPPKARR